MGKKAGKKTILPSDPRPADDDDENVPYDSDEEAEAAALADLEAERANEAEEEANFAGVVGGSGPRGTAVAYNRSGLEAATLELESRDLPWVEQLDVVSASKIEVEDVHDDLARELAFYEMALTAVKEGRERLKAEGVGWRRPDDFYCEMVKSDSHMAKIKDKLIFEQKKMEAFEQRKNRQSQKKFAKATASDLQRDKAAVKKTNIEEVTKWRKDNSERRKQGLADGDGELDNMLDVENQGRANDAPESKSRKRKADDRKYGNGGIKNKKATRNDDRALENMRDFNPKQMKAAAREQGASRKGGKGGGKGRCATARQRRAKSKPQQQGVRVLARPSDCPAPAQKRHKGRVGLSGISMCISQLLLFLVWFGI